MTDMAIGVLGGLIALGLLVGVAFALDRRRKTRDKESDTRDRKVFYASVGLFVGGLLLIAFGAFYSSTAVAIAGILAWICAWGLRWVWRFRKVSTGIPSEGLLQDLEEDFGTQAIGAQRHLDKAYAHEQKDEFEQALRECDLAIQLDPRQAEAHNLRGIVLEELGRKQEAVAAYREAIRLDPDLHEAQENLADVVVELEAAKRNHE